MKLHDFSSFTKAGSAGVQSLHDFIERSPARDLKWPKDVVEQLLFDHADNDSFLAEYGRLELEAIGWTVEVVSVEVFEGVPTDSETAAYLKGVSERHQHEVSVRNYGCHEGVSQTWPTTTWLGLADPEART